MAVEKQKTTDVLTALFNEVDLSDLGLSNINFLFGHPQDISRKLDNNASIKPLIVLFYQDLEEEFIKDSTIYLESDLRLYVMLPFDFAKQSQSEIYTNAIDVTQEIIERIKEASEVFLGAEISGNIKSNPQEHWSMIFTSKSAQSNKINTVSKNVVNMNLSGRDMKFNLDILTKQKCN